VALEDAVGTGCKDRVGDLRCQEAPQPADALDFLDLFVDACIERAIQLGELFGLGTDGLRRFLRLAARAHELADVVIDDVVAPHLTARHDRSDEQFDVDERTVPARPARDEVDVTQLPRLDVARCSFGTHFRRVRDELVDVATDCLVPAVAEQRLGGRVPGDDRVGEVEFDDRRRTVLQEGLKVMLLPLELADIVVNRK
jgi:hypothetical protein